MATLILDVYGKVYLWFGGFMHQLTTGGPHIFFHPEFQGIILRTIRRGLVQELSKKVGDQFQTSPWDAWEYRKMAQSK